MKKSSEQKTQRTFFVVRIVFYAIGKADLLINLLLNKSRKLSELAKSTFFIYFAAMYATYRSPTRAKYQLLDVTLATLTFSPFFRDG